MNFRLSRRIRLSVLGVSILIAAACGGDRRTFAQPPEIFSEVDAGTCADRCSLDGRSVIRCSGEIDPCPIELACGGGSCRQPCDAVATEGSTNGCEFYFQPPLLTTHADWPHSCYAAYLVNTSTVPVDVGLEFEGKALDLSKSMFRTLPGEATLVPHAGALMPGDGVVLFVSDRESPMANVRHIACPKGVVPALLRDYYPDGTQLGSSFHLKTSAPVSAAAVYPFGGAASAIPSATLLLPVASWSKENILINPWEAWRTYSPGVQIVASEDDTDVTIYPKVDVHDGVGVVGTPAGVPATYRLRKGQFLQLVQPRELTGSAVISTKPTSTFAAHTCANVPANVSTCDILGAQIPAFERWGSEYVGVGYRPRTGDEHEPMPYRILAARDGTRLDYDPEVPRGAPLTLNAGEVAAFGAGVGEPFVVRSQDIEHPIYLAAYMTGTHGDYWGGGRDWQTKGDPEFVNVVPTEQYLTNASFYADPTYAETSLVVIRAKTEGEFKDVSLECLGGPVTGFHPIGTRGVYEYARVDLSVGSEPGVTSDGKTCYYGAHHLRSDGLFAATIWGWGRWTSYAYASGMSLRTLVSTPLLPK